MFFSQSKKWKILSSKCKLCSESELLCMCEISTCVFLCLAFSIHTFAESSMKARAMGPTVRASNHGGCFSVLLIRILCFYRLQPKFNLEKERSFDKCYSFTVTVDQNVKSRYQKQSKAMRKKRGGEIENHTFGCMFKE